MNIPPKYEDVVANLDEALGREAALREELEALRESYEAMRDRKNSIVELQQRLTVAERALGGMLFAFDDGVGREWSAPLLDFARTITPAVEFVAALKPAA